MGEAKRRAARWAGFYEGLAADQRVVADAARATWTRLVEPQQARGMCYRLALFLATYLDHRHSITVEPVVGYAHDRTGPLMGSHAWIESAGAVTDLSLAFTDEPSVQLPGQVLILDHVHREGHRYDYRREQDAAALKALEHLRASAYALVERKAEEHRFFQRIANDPIERLTYLNRAPDGGTFEAFARLIEA